MLLKSNTGLVATQEHRLYLRRASEYSERRHPEKGCRRGWKGPEAVPDLGGEGLSLQEADASDEGDAATLAALFTDYGPLLERARSGQAQGGASLTDTNRAQLEQDIATLERLLQRLKAGRTGRLIDERRRAQRLTGPQAACR